MNMQIRINGESREFPGNRTVAELLTSLELNPQQVAVEVNRELVPRESHAEHELTDGDEIEVVSLVGGG